MHRRHAFWHRVTLRVLQQVLLLQLLALPVVLRHMLSLELLLLEEELPLLHARHGEIVLQHAWAVGRLSGFRVLLRLWHFMGSLERR